MEELFGKPVTSLYLKNSMTKHTIYSFFNFISAF